MHSNPQNHTHLSAARPSHVASYLFAVGIICFLTASFSSSLLGNSTGSTAPKSGDSKETLNDAPINDFFLYGDFIHTNNIQTVLFNRKGWDLTSAIIRLHSDETLELRFDDMDADYKTYYYTIIHCDADWAPSDLNPYEYIEGFYEDVINDHARSFNTRVLYSHYYLEFPNANMRPLKSGNYILKVFLNGNRDDVAFTRRFMVVEPLVHIEADVNMANLILYRDTKQQVSFTIDAANYRIANPHQQIKVVLTQNGRWDNAITGLPPRGIQGNRLVYDYEEETLFEGGNEFRRFDTRSLRFLTERVADIQSSSRHWDVFLLPDQMRTNRRYSTDGDINGRFYITNNDGRDHMLESDYAWVHFSLPMHTPLASGSIYVLGELSNWVMHDDNRMNYNYVERKYELSLLLKQGYYNYMYAFLEEGESAAEFGLIEGTHSVAENDYSIFVYHRQPGTLYDRLIGVTHLNSGIR